MTSAVSARRTCVGPLSTVAVSADTAWNLNGACRGINKRKNIDKSSTASHGLPRGMVRTGTRTRHAGGDWHKNVTAETGLDMGNR